MQTTVVAESEATPAYLRALAGVYTRLEQHHEAIDALTRTKNLLARMGDSSGARGESLKSALEQDLEAARDAAFEAKAAATGE